ncbi:MAG: hypothetical protein IT208_04050 [Chthonomonadales bacterium]|nr:hypothetical protein [Chthonomonadales bacterium]
MTHRCETCPARSKAERDPGSFVARLWRWHTRWCPGWRAYQQALAAAATRTRGEGSKPADGAP